MLSNGLQITLQGSQRIRAIGQMLGLRQGLLDGDKSRPNTSSGCNTSGASDTAEYAMHHRRLSGESLNEMSVLNPHPMPSSSASSRAAIRHSFHRASTIPPAATSQ